MFIRNIGRTPGLFFTGEVGCGKTHLAAACANALLQQQVDALFLVVPDFLDDLRASYGKDGEFSEAALMRRARSAAVLILDEMCIRDRPCKHENRRRSFFCGGSSDLPLQKADSILKFVAANLSV